MEELDLLLDLLEKAYGCDSDIYAEAACDRQSILDSINTLKKQMTTDIKKAVHITA
jgi:hypothetical protein